MASALSERVVPHGYSGSCACRGMKYGKTLPRLSACGRKIDAMDTPAVAAPVLFRPMRDVGYSAVEKLHFVYETLWW